MTYSCLNKDQIKYMFIKYSTKIKGSKISNKDFKSFVGFFLSKVAQEFFLLKSDSLNWITLQNPWKTIDCNEVLSIHRNYSYYKLWSSTENSISMHS